VIESAQMCALLASTERLIRILNRGQVYELVYTIKNIPQNIFGRFQSALLNLYGACLELLANLSQLLSRSTAAQTVNAILNPGETEGLYKKLSTLETELSREVQGCEAVRSSDIDARLLNIMKSLEAPVTRIDATVRAVFEHINSNEQIKILEWISSIPYGKHHDTVKNARTPDTCHWLLQHKKFGEWEDASSSMILWLQGSRKLL
jgi:ankyrin repeat domain-containing protein 50